jgi:ligand-binding sensor domain-containing protein/DNA-binding CsgD family transcriptional regulator
MRITCFFVIILSAVSNVSFSQNTLGLPQIINYSKDDYHGGSQTWDIGQDSSGKMYFANNEGLLSFDGNYWKIYPLPNKTIVRSLSIDADGRIYVGGQNEIGFFSPNAKGVLQYTNLNSKIPKQYSQFADVWHIIIFKEAVFFQTSDKILLYQNNVIKVFPAKSEWQFIGQSGGRLFAFERGNELLEYRNNEWRRLSSHLPAKNPSISKIVQITTDSLLVITNNDGFFCLFRDSLFRYDIHPNTTAIRQIYTSLKINPHEIVLGTTSSGCLFMDFKGNIIQKISNTEGLQNSNVLSVFLDKDGNLWTGLNNGISFIAYNSAIKYIKPDKTNELSGYSSVIFNNNLYIGTSNGAYYAPLVNSNKDFSFSKSNFRFIKNSEGQVWKLQEINEHILLGHNDGTFVIENGVCIPVSQGTGSWLFEPMTSVLPAKNILVGAYTGLKMLEYDGWRFSDLGNINGLYESFRYLAIDNDNSVWASHPYRGVYKIRLSDDRENFTYQLYTEKDGLPGTLENYVFQIKNKVVFATPKGIYEYNAATNTFSPSSFLAPIFHNMDIRYLKEDNEGDIWFCSGKKIGVVTFNRNSKSAFKITYFPELTGQILSGFENIYPYNKENIFISSEKGVIHLNYVKYAANQFQLKVLLGNVIAIGKTDSLIFGGYYNQNPKNIFIQKDKDIYQLPKKFNSFHFEYSSPNYGLQKNIEYSYQLKGYDYKWSDWSPKTEKDYTNLPEGKYTFFVKAHDNLGHESEVVAYTFYVKPAWYNTVWAYVGYFILFMLLIFLLFKWQERKLTRQQLKFEQEQKRLEELHQLKLEKREKEIIKLQNEKLENEVKFKNHELASATMHLMERDNALAKVKDELEKLYTKTGNNHDIKKTLFLLKDVEQNNDKWEQFASHFNEVNNDFLRKLKKKYPALSNTDIKVCTYLKLNLSTKEIAQLMNISVRGVEISRYRLRKKLEIPSGVTLNDFLGNVG